jgi:hypothetical protein
MRVTIPRTSPAPIETPIRTDGGAEAEQRGRDGGGGECRDNPEARGGGDRDAPNFDQLRIYAIYQGR